VNAVAVLVRGALARRHLRRNLLVAVVVALAATGLAASLIVRAGAGARVDAAFEAADGAQVALWVRSADTDGALAALADAGASRVSEPRLALDGLLALGDEHLIQQAWAAAEASPSDPS
jgi:hypothetical protein